MSTSYSVSQRKVYKVNSNSSTLAVSIPKALCETLKLEDGNLVDICYDPEDNSIVIKKL